MVNKAMNARLIGVFGVTLIVVAITTALITALLVNIFERKSEARNPYVRLVEVGEDDTDPAKWGINWPKEYESYRRRCSATTIARLRNILER